MYIIARYTAASFYKSFLNTGNPNILCKIVSHFVKVLTGHIKFSTKNACVLSK